jgi:8-oxo-dGTP pyrophosphatase MutT (NUDIX family)
MTKNGQVLGVSRPDDPRDMNMPGGGIESGETPEDAARRELWEETGFLAADLVEIYREGRIVAFRAPYSGGKPRSSEEGLTKWTTYDDIASGRYGDFFKRMLKHLSL